MADGAPIALLIVPVLTRGYVATCLRLIRGPCPRPVPAARGIPGWVPRLPPGSWLVALVVGGVTAASGVGMIVSALVGLAGDGRELGALLIPGGAALAAGLAATRASTRIEVAQAIRPVVGFAAVTAAWVAAAVVGAVPLLASATFGSPLDALFEAMSGFTTTGSTLLPKTEPVADGVLFWRSMTQWLGGVGIVVLVVAIAPASGPGLQRVFYAETSGITAERFTPRIVDTAKILGAVYLGLTVAAATAYLVAGMDVYDAVNHSFTTISTGGFSTHTASIADFDSLALELVAITFMIAGGVNFAFYWRAVRGGPLMPQLAEVRAYLAILAAAIVAVTASLVVSEEVGDVAEALRQAAFSVTTAMTTTGLTTVDFDEFNDFVRFGLVALMIVGGCAGSTAGGMKVIRVTLLGKSAAQELQHQLRPTLVSVLRLGGRPFSERVQQALFSFLLLYLIVFAAGTVALAASGLDAVTSVGGTAATLNMVGPGLGDVGALENFEAFPIGARWVGIVLMLTGRLEIFTVVALLAALFAPFRRR